MNGKLDDITFGPMVYDHEPNDDIKVTTLPYTVPSPQHQITIPALQSGQVGIVAAPQQFANGASIWGNRSINPCGEITLGGLTFAQPSFSVGRHAPFKAGQLVIVNWTLAKHAGQNASLFAEPRITPQGTISNSFCATPMLSAPAPLHTFEGRETMIVLEDVTEDGYEAKVCWDEKVGYVCAYLLLEHDPDALPPEVPRPRRARRVVRDRAEAEPGTRRAR